jgi:hypothetical protein
MRRRRFPLSGGENAPIRDDFAASGAAGLIAQPDPVLGKNFSRREPVPTRRQCVIEPPCFLFPHMKAKHMTKLLFAIPLVLITSAAMAQQDRQKGHDACARDVSRHCRAQMQEGDQLVLACLKTNRAKISKGCQQMLASHGQ